MDHNERTTFGAYCATVYLCVALILISSVLAPLSRRKQRNRRHAHDKHYNIVQCRGAHRSLYYVCVLRFLCSIQFRQVPWFRTKNKNRKHTHARTHPFLRWFIQYSVVHGNICGLREISKVSLLILVLCEYDETMRVKPTRCCNTFWNSYNEKLLVWHVNQTKKLKYLSFRRVYNIMTELDRNCIDHPTKNRTL